MNNNSSGVFPSLFLMVVVLVGGGYILSQLLYSMEEIKKKNVALEETVDELTLKSNQVDDLFAQIQQKDQQIANLKAQLTDVNLQKDQILGATQQCVTDKQILSDRLAATANERDDIRKKLDQATVELEDLQNQMNAMAKVVPASPETEKVIPGTGSEENAVGPEKVLTPLGIRAYWWLSIPLIGGIGLVAQAAWTSGRRKPGKTDKVQVWMTREQLQDLARYQRSQQRSRNIKQ